MLAGHLWYASSVFIIAMTFNCKPRSSQRMQTSTKSGLFIGPKCVAVRVYVCCIQCKHNLSRLNRLWCLEIPQFYLTLIYSLLLLKLIIFNSIKQYSICKNIINLFVRVCNFVAVSVIYIITIKTILLHGRIMIQMFLRPELNITFEMQI